VAVPVLVIGGLLRSFASPMVGSVRRVSVTEWVRNWVCHVKRDAFSWDAIPNVLAGRGDSSPSGFTGIS
jgi:hypothetical protein